MRIIQEQGIIKKVLFSQVYITYQMTTATKTTTKLRIAYDAIAKSKQDHELYINAVSMHREPCSDMIMTTSYWYSSKTV